MVHQKMIHLLPQVYNGRLGQEHTGLQEFGGEKVSAAVTPGGLKIAGIEQVKIHFSLHSLDSLLNNHCYHCILE